MKNSWARKCFIYILECIKHTFRPRFCSAADILKHCDPITFCAILHKSKSFLEVTLPLKILYIEEYWSEALLSSHIYKPLKNNFFFQFATILIMRLKILLTLNDQVEPLFYWNISNIKIILCEFSKIKVHLGVPQSSYKLWIFAKKANIDKLQEGYGTSICVLIFEKLLGNIVALME